jgi:putative flippase GtrA
MQFIKFILVGGLNTLIGYLVFSFFLFLNFHYALASFFALMIGILFNFKTHGRLVFGSRNNSLIFRYVVGWVVVYVAAVACLAGFEWFGVNLYLANALLIPPLTVVAFFINLKFVFQEARPWPMILKK